MAGTWPCRGHGLISVALVLFQNRRVFQRSELGREKRRTLGLDCVYRGQWTPLGLQNWPDIFTTAPPGYNVLMSICTRMFHANTIPEMLPIKAPFVTKRKILEGCSTNVQFSPLLSSVCLPPECRRAQSSTISLLLTQEVVLEPLQKVRKRGKTEIENWRAQRFGQGNSYDIGLLIFFLFFFLSPVLEGQFLSENHNSPRPPLGVESAIVWRNFQGNFNWKIFSLILKSNQRLGLA